ncbi:DUF4395 domain-containing protein [Chryseomicrobium palamuruense]|uniref:DUF4395 domain-containing protein n=1 Tax=Chryseomicrobium palamuruense TaxID=682973 RepID=A0ABV8UUB7_9BACL
MKTIPKPLVTLNQWIIVVAVILALVTQSFWPLLVPFIANGMSLVFGFHPILAPAKKLLKKPMSSYVQEDVAQLRFNQMMAVGFLAVAIAGALFGSSLLFFAASIMVGVAAAVALAGFCVGCFIRFQYQQWKYRRSISS